MQKKIVLLAFLMIALIALAQIAFPVVAYVKEERVLQPISGSNVDARTFYWGSHLIADGFAVTTSMDLPAAVKTSTQTRFGFAVGLGDQWEEQIDSYRYRYTPYVDNMWLTIRGDADYSVVSLGSISDNTGTGDPSSLFTIILEALGVLFTAYDIANFVSKACEEPPREEWQRNEHWATAIVRQSGDIRVDPRLQTACASLMSYFHNHKWNTLNITAEAELCIQILCYNWWCYRFYIGTYRSSFEVKVAADEPPETPSKPSGTTSGYSSHAIDPEDDNIRYQFDWGDGSNTTTGWYTSGATASASHSWGSSGTYYVKVKAQDEYGEWSGWSPSLTVYIPNRAPNTPSKPSGPTSGYRDVEYTYSTSTTDPDEDDVRYEFEFSGPIPTKLSTTGWYASGETVGLTVFWETTDPLGTYYVRVRAQDVNGLWSGWSSSLTVSISDGGGGGGGGGGGDPKDVIW